MTASIVALAAAMAAAPASAEQLASVATRSTLEEAQRLFYSGHYDGAAALALTVRAADAGNLAALELRSSALHFQIRRVFGTPQNKERAWKTCGSCEELLAAFVTETNLGRSMARARLNQSAVDEDALFFLGKFNLNVVWLQLATLGRRSGWSEYWEARRSLDAVLTANPQHVRARVARAWIDYIVDTKVPWGTRWLLGGGNKKRGLQTVREAAQVDAPPYVQAEAMFALWDMQVRERSLADAVVTARALAQDFPDNRELTKFLDTHDLQGSR
ncbi:MAG TPA: hypothetical protein VIK60_10615 [Vicinamibacterales bacterium]